MMKLNSKIIVFLIVFLMILQIGMFTPALQAEQGLIQIMKYSVSSDAIARGEQFNLSITVKNTSDGAISSLYLEAVESSGFAIQGSNKRIRVSAELKPGATESVSINMVYQGGGDGQIPLVFTYNKTGYERPITEERYLSVKLADGSVVQPGDRYLPVLQIKDKETLHASAGSTLEGIINLQNISTYQIQEVLVKASFAADAPFSFPNEQMFYFRSLNSGEIKTIKLNLETAANAAKGSYPLKMDYEFMNSAGESFTASENIYVRVEDPPAPPALILTLELNEDAYLVSGEDFELLIKIKNQGELEARDIVISLEGLSSDSIYVSSGSNRQYLDDIPLGMEQEVKYIVQASPDLDEGIYPLVLRADFTDQAKKIYSDETKFTLAVKPKPASEGDGRQGSGKTGSTDIGALETLSNLEVGNIRFTGDMEPDKLVNLYCTYYNTGRAGLSNLIIKLNGDFDALDEIVFVGDMKEDSAGYFHGTIKPRKPGEISGRLIFSYQDQSGEPLVLVEPFTLRVGGETPVSESKDESGFEGQAMSAWYIIIPVAIIGAAAGWQTQRRKGLNQGMGEDE